MGINELRIAVTVVSLAVFVGIVAWAWSGKRRARFDADALIPLLAQEDDA